MSTGKVLLGVLAGVAAGAVLGILFAPDKGSETRKKITKKSSETMDDVMDKFEELVSGLTEKVETIKAEANHVYEKGKHKTEEFIKDSKG